MFRKILVVAACGFAPATFAHEGPRIWIGNENGRITTYSSDNDFEPTVYERSRLFTTEFDSFFNIFTTDFPGFEVRQDGGGISSGATFGFVIAGPLRYFDGVNDRFETVKQMFELPDPTPQLAVSLSSQIRTTSSSRVVGFNFFTFHQIGDHAHLSFTLLGDGVTASDGPSGVYALPLRLTGVGLANSATFFLLIGKDYGHGDPLFERAEEVARLTLVPEKPPHQAEPGNSAVNVEETP